MSDEFHYESHLMSDFTRRRSHRASSTWRVPPIAVAGSVVGNYRRIRHTFSLSISLVLDNGTRTKPQSITDLQVKSIPGGVGLFTESTLRFSNPQHRGVTALWYHLNGVPWHVTEDWPSFTDWSQDAPDPLIVEWGGRAVVEL